MKPDMESAQRHISDCLEEINRLKAINAELLEALEKIVEHQCYIAGNSTAALSGTHAIAKAAIANAAQPLGETK